MVSLDLEELALSAAAMEEGWGRYKARAAEEALLEVNNTMRII